MAIKRTGRNGAHRPWNKEVSPLLNEMPELLSILKEVREYDRVRLRRRIELLSNHLQAGRDCRREIEQFIKLALKAKERSLVGVADRLKIEYPENLPISAHRQEILNALKENQVIVVCGSTGSGKTTQLPKIALELGRGKFGAIGCTQPRRLAATAMAGRVADELKCTIGREVGYKVRFDNRTSGDTVVKFMTDGMLLSEIAGDPDLLYYDTLIIDEVHERSLNIDFLLGFLKRLCRKRPELKLIISSATLDAERFSIFFNNAPVIMVEGRGYPVEDFFLPPEDDEELSSHIARAVQFIDEIDPHGDILVFLPGEREIRDAADLLEGRKLKNTEVLPLFARLSMADQQRIFSPGNRRRIILATNVAETSVTIPRIHYVIDSGLARISRYNGRTGIQELQIEQISQASAKQRRGRCGRLADGICVYLYSEDDLSRAPQYTDPEIRRTSLAGVILQMAMMRLGKIENFPFIDPPLNNLIREGRRTLQDIGAIDEQGSITAAGRKIAGFPLDPHLAKMVLKASEAGVLHEVMIIVGFLSILDPRERPQDKQQAADTAHAQWRDKESDFITILNIWNFLVSNSTSNTSLRKLAKRNFLNANRVMEWRNLTADIYEFAHDQEWQVPDKLWSEVADYPVNIIHQAVLSGIPRNIGCYFSERGYYQGTGNRRFQLFPGSGLAKLKNPPKWVMSLALVETTRVFARQNAIIQPEFLELVAPHLCSATYDQAYFEPKSGFVYARERVVSGGLLIHSGRRVHYGAVDPDEARKIFIREGLCEGLIQSRNKQIKAHLNRLAALWLLEEKVRRPGTVVDKEAIFEALMKRLPREVVSTKSLEQYLNGKRVFPLPDDEMMFYQYHPVEMADYPDFMEISGEKYPLQYTFDPESPADGVAVMIPRAELNIISGAHLDYLIPGYLPEKVEFMLRRLPKVKRMTINPVISAVEGYMNEFRSGRVPVDLSLKETLCDYLSENYEGAFIPADFGDYELPGYLIMKIGVLNNSGAVEEYLTSVPAGLDSGSRVSGRLARNYAVTPGSGWPGHESLPEETVLPDNDKITVYPALCSSDDGISRALFLRKSDAELMHRRGIIALFRCQNMDLVKFVRKGIKLANNVKLSLFYDDVDRSYVDSIVNWAVARTMGGVDDLWDIRSEALFLERATEAKMNLADEVDAIILELTDWADKIEQIDDLRRKIGRRAPDGVADVKRQMKFLFRSGFINTMNALEGYSRYLRGMKIRLERMNSSPLKDEEKLEELAPLLERFGIAADGDISAHPQLCELFIALEELRLAVFAPEVRPKRKISLKMVQDMWDNLRI